MKVSKSDDVDDEEKRIVCVKSRHGCFGVR